MVEYAAVDALQYLSEIGGMPVEGAFMPLPFHRKGRECYGFLVCPDAVVMLEFKRRLTCGNVREFLDRQLPEFRRLLSITPGSCALYAALASATMDDDAAALAEENGLFTIRISEKRKAVVVNDNGRPLA